MKRLVRLQYNSPVVLTFALLSLAALLLDKFTGGWTTVKLFSVYRSPLTDILTYPRFVLHVLGHSGYSHYIGNMMMILVVGPPLEEKYGSRSLFWAIFLTALVSGLVQWLFFPGTALLGASGIVFMMIVMSSLAGMKDGYIPQADKNEFPHLSPLIVAQEPVPLKAVSPNQYIPRNEVL